MNQIITPEGRLQRTHLAAAKAWCVKPDLDSFQKTDAGNAEALLSRYGEDLRYCSALGWRTWTGARWEAGDERLLRLARQTIREMLHDAAQKLKQAASTEGETETKRLTAEAEVLLKHARRSEAAPRLKAMVELASSFIEVEVEPDAFNLKPWQVPFQNGTWSRGVWRPEHRREDYLEELLPVTYRPETDRTDWYALLGRMTGADDDLARTLQDIAGYALSGASSLRTIPWLYGGPGVGKSTFCELLQTVMGSAAGAMDRALVSGECGDEAIGRAVRGKRALFLAEMGRKRVSAETLKALSGGDTWPCRMLYSSHSFRVPATWVLLATSNGPPEMSAIDDALKDRLLALPFKHRLADGPKLRFTGDARLEEIRRDPKSPLVQAFVAWAVEGLAAIFDAQDIHRASVTVTHTARFWQDADPLTEFWETVSEEELRKGKPTSELRYLYMIWCEREQIRHPLGSKAWGSACRSVGLKPGQTTGGARIWTLPAGQSWVAGSCAVAE